jgi:hypothetical protein
MEQDLKLAPWVHVHEEVCRGGRERTLLVNARDGIAFRLTPAELHTLHTAAQGDDDVHPELIGALRSGGFFDQPRSAPVPERRRSRLVRLLSTFDVATTKAQAPIARWHDRALHCLFDRRWFRLQVMLALAGVVALTVALESSRPFEFRPQAWQLPFAIALSLIAVAIHELAHGLVIVHHGRRVKSVGFRLHLGTPSFYVDSVEAMLLDRRQRMLQAAAGPWAEWLFTAAVAMLLWLVPFGPLTLVVHRFVILNTITIASNLLPFAGLDGSLILADALHEPDLAYESRQATTRLRHGQERGDGLLVAYAALNAAVSTALLVFAMLIWWGLFGGVLGGLAAKGPFGVVALCLVLATLFGPAVVTAAGNISRALPIDRVRFRLERRVRVRCVRQLAMVAPFDRLSASELGVLAGQFELHRPRRDAPVTLDPAAEVALVDGHVRLAGDGLPSHITNGHIRCDDAQRVVAGAARRCRAGRVAVLPAGSLRLVGLNVQGSFLQACSHHVEPFGSKEGAS